MYQPPDFKLFRVARILGSSSDSVCRGRLHAQYKSLHAMPEGPLAVFGFGFYARADSSLDYERYIVRKYDSQTDKKGPYGAEKNIFWEPM